MKALASVLILAVLVTFWGASFAAAHCEIPCGIYDDEMRIKMIAEHITTMEKSMQQVTALREKSPVDYNQITRWVMNKEHHANELQKIVTQYFMTQRIKPGASDYMKKISTLHKMLITAMKCKQSIDLAHIGTLKSLLDEFRNTYFGGGQEKEVH